MDQLRKFLQGKGFAIALAACLLAAAAAGVWAVRLIRSELQKDLEGLQDPNSTARQIAPGVDEGMGLDTEEAEQWAQDTAPAAHSVANVPESAPSAPQSSSSASSGAGSTSGSVSEPSALQTDSAPAGSSASPASARPVSGRMLNAYSGDELVYNKTLCDWRTHNGVDYACKEGETVQAPVSGTVSDVSTDGNWGALVCLTDAEGRQWRLCGVTAAVQKGAAVTAGQTLGKASRIGCECAEESHIHLEVREGEKYRDPAKLIG